MVRLSVKSTNVKSVGYDPETKTLEVEFRTGGVYQYPNVPPAMYADLLASDSIGRFVATVVRASRKGVKIDEAAAGEHTASPVAAPG